MELFSAFFNRTRIFWIVSRLFLGLIFGYCAYFLLKDVLPGDLISVSFLIVLSTVILWIFYLDLFRLSTNKFLKIITGSVLILIGLFGVYTTSSIFGFSGSPFMLLACLWFALAGLYDLFSIRKSFTNFFEIIGNKS